MHVHLIGKSRPVKAQIIESLTTKIQFVMLLEEFLGFSIPEMLGKPGGGR